MTRRERLERKLEKREDWAAGRKGKSDAAFNSSLKVAERFHMGQPILVGHHSEKQARRDHERCDNYMRKSVENQKMAEHHSSKAEGLRSQLENTIFSDDDDAIEQLEAKIAKLQAKQEHMKAVNKICRSKKFTKDEKATKLKENFSEFDDTDIHRLLNPTFLNELGFASYELTNNNSNIRRCKERVKQIKADHARKQKAEDSENGISIIGNQYVSITFAEKPEREVLTALKDAGFYWRRGSWNGKRENIPEEVTELL